MINVAQFYEKLKQLGILLYLDKDMLRYKAEKEKLTEDVKDQIVACKTEMLAFLKKREEFRLSRENTLPSLEAISNIEHIPLSFGQKQLWLLEQLQDDKGSYNLPVAYHINGEVNISALEKSVQEIIQRHAVLRTAFYEFDGDIYQRVVNEFKTPFEVVDFQQKKNLSWDELVLEEKFRKFDRQGAQWCRVKLIQLAVQEYLLIVTMHHIVSDGWSIGIFINELSQLYQDFCESRSSSLPPLQFQYIDHAVWQDKILSGAYAYKQRALQYWYKQLEGVREAGILPYKSATVPMSKHLPANFHSQLNSEVAEKIRQYCLANDLTSFMFLQGVLAIVLGRFTNTQDIAIGTVVAGRTTSETETLLGFFINTLVMRSRFDESDTVKSYMHLNRNMILDAFANQDLPFALLLQELNAVEHMRERPLFQVMMILQNNRIGSLDMGQSKFERVSSNATVNTFDLELDVSETNTGFYIVWSFNKHLFDESYIHQLSQSYETLLKQILLSPQARLQEIPLL
ncbi:MAG: condensation domain-containing protein, partial [Pseudomonadota bacterium]